MIDRTFDVPALGRFLMHVDHSFVAEGGMHQERFVWSIRGTLSRNIVHTDVEKHVGWAFGRPYDLDLTRLEIPTAYDVVQKTIHLVYSALPIKRDLRHPVLVLRKRQVTYAQRWR